MATYLILCADTVGQHQHVTAVSAAKWRTDKGGYPVAQSIDCSEVAALIRSGNHFFIATPDDAGRGLGTSEVQVTQCRLCREPTIRTMGGRSADDNLDFMPCE